MNELIDHDDTPSSRQDRELTLGTGTILGIFLGLVILCGACFGVGYTLGHKSQPAPLALNDTNAETPGAVSQYKPSAGSPVDSTIVAPSTTPAPGVTVPLAVTRKPAPVVRKPPPAPAIADADASDDAPVLTHPADTARTPLVKPVPPSALLPSASPSAGSGSIMVQVAAVSHREDADLLVGALHARGYTVAARPSTGDSLIHVQVGPFSSKPAAEAMRQRLIGDGYNAMLKY